MTNRILIDDMTHLPLADDADALALLRDILDSIPTYLADSMTYARDRFDMISDYDDYLPAAARLLSMTTSTYLSHEYDTPRDALLFLISDRDFLLDLLTLAADHELAIITAIDLDYID